MPYVGRDPRRGNYLKLDDIQSSFNGSDKTFNLTSGGTAYYPDSTLSVLVSVGGTVLEPATDYGITNNQITFTNAPLAAYNFFAIVQSTAVNIGVPGDAVVTGEKLAKPLWYDDYFKLDSNNNRVGIGTDNPTNKLHLYEQGNDSVSFKMQNHEGTTTLQADGDAFHIDAGAHYFRNAAGTTSRIVIESGGNVGIGTDNPSNADSGAYNLVVEGGNNTGLSIISGGASPAGSRIYFGRGYSGSDNRKGQINYLHSGDDADSFTFHNATTETLRINSSGQVLIGHTATVGSGVSKLQVSTNAKEGIDINGYSTTAADGGRLTFYRSQASNVGTNTLVANGDSLGRIDFRGFNSYAGSDGIWELGAVIEAVVDDVVNESGDMASSLIFKTTANDTGTPYERLRINSAGIATFQGDITLEAAGANRISMRHTSGGAAVIKNPTAANLSFGTNNNDEELVIENGGKVGINTTTPGAQLEVKGSGSSNTLSFLTKDVNKNNVFWIKDGGRVGLHYSPLVINQDTGDSDTPSGTYFYVHHASHPFIIKNDGKVGVGSDAPVGNLDIRDSSKTNLIVAKDGLLVKSNSDLATSYDMIQLGAGGALASYSAASVTADTMFIHNAYRHSGNDWKRRYSDTAARMRVNSPANTWIFETAETGDADSIISSWDESLRILGDGEVLIGGRSAWGSNAHPNTGNKLVISGPSPANVYNNILYLEGNEISGAVDTGGALSFGGHDGSVYRNWGNIYGMKENGTGGNRASYMSFHTRIADGDPGEKLRITSTGKVSITSSGTAVTDPFAGLYLQTDGYDIDSGNAIKDSTMGGMVIHMNSNDDKSVGLWFATNNAHWSGISGQRSASATTWGTDLRFYTHEDATNDLTYTRERLRITSAGDIHSKESVQSGGNATGGFKFSSVDTACVLGIQQPSAAADTNAAFQIWDGATNNLRINYDGEIKTAKGINFSNYGAEEDPDNTSTDVTSNLLDDYEEGSWTPTIIYGSTTQPSGYHSNTGGWYVKVGRMVTCNGRIQLSSKSGDEGAVKFGGLPFTVGDNNSGISAVEGGLHFTYLSNVDSDDGAGIIGGYANQGTTQAIPFYVDTSNHFHNVEDFDIESDASIGFVITYCV